MVPAMQIEVRFFAGLRERFGVAARQVSVVEGSTAQALWAQLTGEEELPSNLRVAVNFEYVEATQPLSEGDEVAYFPPVTGG